MRHALILCGGYGSRLGYITKKTPKPLIKIGKISFLERLIKSLKKIGLKKIYLSTFYKSNQFKKVKNVEIIKEKHKLGPGGAILYSLKKIKNVKEILITNGDTITNLNIQAFYSSHIKMKKIFSVLTVKKKSNNRYGGFLKKKGKISFTKNLTTMPIDCGVYIVNKNKLLSIFKKKGTFEIASIINKLLSINQINIFQQKNLKFIDIGQKKDLDFCKKNLFFFKIINSTSIM
jgi:NDP-sugar pyrophosphorylase family protein